jgi:hypothetical protein
MIFRDLTAQEIQGFMEAILARRSNADKNAREHADPFMRVSGEVRRDAYDLVIHELMSRLLPSPKKDVPKGECPACWDQSEAVQKSCGNCCFPKEIT